MSWIEFPLTTQEKEDLDNLILDIPVIDSIDHEMKSLLESTSTDWGANDFTETAFTEVFEQVEGWTNAKQTDILIMLDSIGSGHRPPVV